MGFLDMFDKIDDIIYKPVEAVCNWINEPINKWEHNREMESKRLEIEANADEMNARRSHEEFMAKQASDSELALEKQKAENEIAYRKLEQELTEQERVSQRVDLEERARIDADIRKWNAEIDMMISEQEAEQRDKLVESIKRYQIDLANAAKDIVESIGLMSLELRERANNMVLEKTNQYRAIQEESKNNAIIEMKEIKDMFFEDDPETYKIMRDEIIEERRAAFELAGRFIAELSEDMKRLNQNTDCLMSKALENADKYIGTVAGGLGNTLSSSYQNTKLIK